VQNVVMLSVKMVSVIMVSVITLSVIVLNVIMLSVTLLNVLEPFDCPNASLMVPSYWSSALKQRIKNGHTHMSKDFFTQINQVYQ
jgi:hypothetical protein